MVGKRGYLSMNRIFKSKWCAVKQSYVACSELSKRAGKIAGGGMILLAASSIVNATNNLPITISTTGEVTGKKYDKTLNNSFFNINNGAVATLKGDMSFNIKANGDNETRIDVTNGSLVTEDKLSIMITPEASVKHSRPKGMIIRGDSNSRIKDLDVDVTLASEEDKDNGTPDSNASYGVALGYDSQGGENSKYARLIVDNADINVTNTVNTVQGSKTVTRSFLGFPITAKVIFGHQLSGLKIYRKNGATPEFISNGKLNINVTDSSTAKSGDYLVGVYISGNGSKAVFNGDTTISVKANGINSAGIKIGKPIEKSVETGEKGASVISHGKLIVDTTMTKESAAVRLFGQNSKFEITGEKTDQASEIKSGNSAIVFDTQDYKTFADVTLAGRIETSRNENNTDNSVKLKNTILTTTSVTDSLIKVKAERVRDQSFGQQGRFSDQLTHGNFNVKNATFTLSGEKSFASAAEQGWLVEVQGQRNISSDLNVDISDKAVVEGLMYKTQSSKLNVNVDTNAVWNLKKKGDITTSVVNNLTLSNQAILDAGKYLTEADKAQYTLKLSSDGTRSDGLLTNSGTITMDNNSHNDVLTLEGNYTAKPGATLRVNTLWNTPGDENGINSKSDLLEIKGFASGKTQVFARTVNTHQQDLIDGSIGSIKNDLNTYSAPIVRIYNPIESEHHAFVGTARTTGAGQLQLKEVDKTDPTGGQRVREYVWTLTVANTAQPILDSTVAAYTQMPLVNLEQSYMTVGTLHSRRGENQIFNWDYSNDISGQSWGRIRGSHLHTKGKTRLAYDTDMLSAQIGYDFALQRTNDKGHRLTGVYAAYTRANADFFDHLRAEHALILEDKYTGKGKATGWALGINHTRYAENGSYLDLVGQLTFLSNKYTSRELYSAKNKGTSYLVSAEVGRPFVLNKHERNQANWLIEPQAQLSYQYLDMAGFNDNQRQVEQGNIHSLRGRLGARLAYNQPAGYENSQTKTFYLTANLLHDLNHAKSVKIGKDKIRDKYEKTWWDIGLGIQHPISQKVYVYIDVSYKGSFTGERKHEGYRGGVGLKYNW